MRILYCLCGKELGPARELGSGRQVELCDECFNRNNKRVQLRGYVHRKNGEAPEPRMLVCAQCKEEIGPARLGNGRQVELCRPCFKANRKRNERRWDKIRQEERRSVKRKPW